MSRYLERFTALSDIKDKYQLIGDVMLVEKIKPGEQKIGSIIIAQAPNHKSDFLADQPAFVRVLAVGEGYYDDTTKESVPLSVKPGDIILVPAMSVKYFSVFPGISDYELNTIGLTRESEIQMRFMGEEGYNQMTELLAKFAKKPDENKTSF